MNSKGTVYVGLSGGVDSSVAAYRLLQAGYDVVGVFIKVWHPDFMVCNWEQERLDAMRVAAFLNIPFLTCDAEAAYKQDVADTFIAEYLAGRTPNPDILCNQHVKFGHFYTYARQRGADYIATGHYVQKVNGELHRGQDQNKDQSYFLWALPNETLQHCLFPIGTNTKDVIRREAKKVGLTTADKRDSQGICFLGHVDIPEFLSHYTDLEEGEVLDTSGQVIGVHRGALVYTIGQRHGFTISDENATRRAMYVVERNIAANTITVAPERPSTKVQLEVILRNTVLRTNVQAGDKLLAQFRYRQEPFSVNISSVNDDSVTLITEKNVAKPAVGQSCVLYRDSHCIGGGVIDS